MKKRWLILLLVVMVGMGLMPVITLAQAGLDPYGEPTWGNVTIEAPFIIDPYVTTIGVGGDINLSTAGGNCVGFTDSVPSFNFTAEGSPATLTFFLLAAEDTTLAILTPNGQLLCDDDSGGERNPQVTIEGNLAGTYNIWGASYSDTMQPAYLFISESSGSITDVVSQGFGSVIGMIDSTGQNAMGGATALDIGVQPTFGTVELASGFTPDPYPIDLVSGSVAGNSVDLAMENIGSVCVGYVTAVPDVAVQWSGGGSNLRFFAVTDADTTLVIRTPDGQFLCNDDFTDMNPLIDVANPRDGIYHIWVGSFVQDTNAITTLYVSELMNVDPSNVN